MPEDIKPKYNIEFIYLSFNLIPVYSGEAAIAPNAITDIRLDKEMDEWRITLHGGTIYNLTHPEMADLEQAIRQRGEDALVVQREMFKQQAVMQNDVMQELQRGVVGAQIVGMNKKRH